jgi:pseudouridylate synthase
VEPKVRGRGSARPARQGYRAHRHRPQPGTSGIMKPMAHPPPPLRFAPEVEEALRAGGAVVALESTLIAHGLPAPDNLVVARELEDIVRAAGAVPATVAVLAGVPHIGLSAIELERIATLAEVRKLSTRDLGPAVAAGIDGATTVASTAALAARAGIRLFATGGLGGVHREARDSWDESADLVALGHTPVCVVCAGVKSILDVPATLERLETLGVTVLGYGTDRFPGFYLSDSGYPAPWRVDTPEAAAAVVRASVGLGLPPHAVVLANPLPPAAQLDPALHDRVLAEGLAAAAEGGVRGSDVTPFLLDHFHRATQGASLRANVEVVRRNADLAARVAVALASQP